MYHDSAWLGRDQNKPVAQRQKMIIGTLALLKSLYIVAFQVSRALALKGDEFLQNTGGICIYVLGGLRVRGYCWES